MKIACLHEFYISFKLFETIGFHNEGTYGISASLAATREQSITLAYPISIRQKKPTHNQMGSNPKINHSAQSGSVYSADCQYHSAAFDVSFNEQVFPFSGGCKFRLEIEPENEDEYQFQVVLKLNKCQNGQGNGTGMGYSGVTDRSECAIIDPNQLPAKQLITTTDRAMMDTMSQSKILINPKSGQIQSLQSCYRKVVFSTNQYFSSLFITVSHCQMGFKIRPNPYGLTFFANNPQATNINKKREPARTLTQAQVYSLLRKHFGDTKQLYNKMVCLPIQQLKKLQQLHSHLEKTCYKVILSENNKKMEKSLVNPTSNLKFTIQISDRDDFQQEEDLLSFYEAENLQVLWLMLFEEHRQIMKGVAAIWHTCMFLYSRQEYSSKYLHRYFLGLKQQLEYVSKNRFAGNIEQARTFKQFVPDLKFVSEKYLNIPYFFRQQSYHEIPLVVIQDQGLEDEIQQENTLFILVHGFNGNEFDMNKIKSYLGLFYTPQFLVLRNISTKTLDSLQEIGEVAATEIKAFLSNGLFIKKINFIGFSLGGLIIRACLPHLYKYHHLFNLMITLSSPHLGVNELNSCIVRTGVTFLHKIKGVKNLKQMTIDIGPHKKQKNQKYSQEKGNKYSEKDLTYFQKLCGDQSISFFKLVVVVGSEEDKYVPGYSSCMQYEGQNARIIAMQKSLVQRIANLHRISVTFDKKNRGNYWERFSGRRIHINFLDDEPFLFFLFSEYFHKF